MGVALNWFGFFLFIMVWLDCLHRIPCVRVVLVLVTKDGWQFDVGAWTGALSSLNRCVATLQLSPVKL